MDKTFLKKKKWVVRPKTIVQKKIKLQQVAQELKTITEMFNKQTKPEPVIKQ
jgi:hypothetical protein